MTISTRSHHLTAAVLAALSPHMSAGQLKQLAPDIEAAINKTAPDLDAIEVEAGIHSTTLGQKFQALLTGMMPNGVPEKQALFAQAFFLGGAYSAFQILAHANTRPPEESLVIWSNLQNEIKAAAPKRPDAVAERRLII